MQIVTSTEVQQQNTVVSSQWRLSRSHHTTADLCVKCVLGVDKAYNAIAHFRFMLHKKCIKDS